MKRRSFRPINAVFIRPTKVAGTSINKALSLKMYRSSEEVDKFFTQGGMVDFGHMRYLSLVEGGHVSKAFDENSYKFTFVRNPYDRAVSSFTDLALRGRGRTSIKKKVREMGFLGFCRRFLGGYIEPIGLHHIKNWSVHNPQIRWIEGVEIDFLGRFENLEEDFSRLVTNLGLPKASVELPWARWSRTPQRRPHYSAFFCDETKEIVERAWSEDFERFNYPRELSFR